jgi:hypothetical protein
MNNKEMIGMFSAYAAAKEMPYGSNMTISAALVVEMVERIVELKRELYKGKAKIKNQKVELTNLNAALKEPKAGRGFFIMKKDGQWEPKL